MMRRFWDSLRQYGRPVQRSGSDASRSFPSGVRSGNPGVFYDDQGRLYYRGDRAEDRDKYLLRPEDTLTYDPRRSYSDSRGTRSLQRSHNNTPRNSGRSNVITKHFDSYRKSPKINYPGRIVPAGYMAYNNSYGREGRRYIREGSVIIEEHIVSHERPWLWPLFLIAGLLILLVGVLNALFCVDNYYYVHIWTPITILIFAIIGAVHKGIYTGGKGKWRNILHIIAGIVATVFVFLATAFVMMRLNHVTLQIAEEGTSGFVTSEESKMARYNEEPRIIINSLSTNIWMCYSLDWVAVVLLIVCLAILSSTVIIANNYYNSTQEYRREIEPFCRPQLFNPYGQISLGEAIAFVGIVLKSTIHGNISIEWQDYWISVWVAILPMISGPVTAIALKRVGLSKHKLLVVISAILQFITLIVTIAAVVFGTIALSDNIKALSPGPMAVTTYSKSLLTASVFLFAINDIMLLIGLIYALALFIRLIAEGCKKEDKDLLNEKKYYTEDRYQSYLRPMGTDRYPSSPGRDKIYTTNGTEAIKETLGPRY